ncbi:hypothetical protein N8I71_09025 [Roseibacterium sp. SDUM158016]|uniref:hypothetical protein n=1 Tax=Roseicyclus sediminis TaxID=2980997 RepID=UPI0021D1A0D5|nr:hypothetical protein [Roseibacterium sp. SDUM158016]MCU4652972.1 hypothetical protein [Roseibacterium sp. SDUM158016]
MSGQGGGWCGFRNWRRAWASPARGWGVLAFSEMVWRSDAASDDLRAELAAYQACDGIVSFEMLVLQKP